MRLVKDSNILKKTATLTFQNSENYGALLQAYALQKKLFSIGVENEVLNYRCEYLGKPYGFSALKRKGVIRYFLGIAYSLVRIPRKSNFKKFRSLIKMTRVLKLDDLNSLNENYDAFIAGSDQVWNDSITNFDSSYYLDFVDSPEKKMSYAASFGFETIPENLKPKYRKLLKEFSVFNMREESGVKNIKMLLNKSANLVLDPTMLLSKKEWDKVASSSVRKNKYILVYQTTISSFLVNIVKALSISTGYKIICIPFPLGGFLKSKFELTAGPGEWIGLIRDAEIVITDSFHGTAFSILYNKEFYVCLTDGVTRITNLLNLFELDNRICIEYPKLNLNKKINWDRVNKKLIEERHKSTECLEAMLNY
tara:strand:- start:14073 stop:15170 length:1098 start_codon:yes stop_codon:yes gene_type:complete